MGQFGSSVPYLHSQVNRRTLARGLYIHIGNAFEDNANTSRRVVFLKLDTARLQRYTWTGVFYWPWIAGQRIVGYDYEPTTWPQQRNWNAILRIFNGMQLDHKKS